MDMTNSVKKGSKIVKVLIGGGYETCSVREIEHVDTENKIIYLEGCDGDYNKESVYAYDATSGRECASYIPGFSCRLILLDND